MAVVRSVDLCYAVVFIDCIARQFPLSFILIASGWPLTIPGRYAQLCNLNDMTFEDFRLELETELRKIVRFELQEFHYEPYSFGNGLLAYRINGTNYRLKYDGREKQITVDVSEQHQKYFGASWNRSATIDELSNGVPEIIELLNLSEHSK